MGRLRVLPGITGLWQVGFADMISLDLAYAADDRLLTDLRILMRTFSAVISGKGAY